MWYKSAVYLFNKSVTLHKMSGALNKQCGTLNIKWVTIKYVPQWDTEVEYMKIYVKKLWAGYKGEDQHIY